MSNPVEDIALVLPEEDIPESIAEEVAFFFTFGDARVLSVVAVDSTHVRVTFVRPLIDNAAVRCGEIYTIVSPVGARDINVYTSTPEDSPVISVLLLVDEMLQGGSYELDILTLEEAP